MHKCATRLYQAKSVPPRLEREGHDSRARIVPTILLHSRHPWRSDGGVRTASGTAVEGGGVDNQRSHEAAPKRIPARLFKERLAARRAASGQNIGRFYAVALRVVHAHLAQPCENIVVLDEFRYGLLTEEVPDLVDRFNQSQVLGTVDDISHD